MTSLIAYLLGRQPCFPANSTLADNGHQPLHRERNRLKKEPPPEIFFSCEDLQDTLHCQSSLTWRPNNSNATVVYSDHPEPQLPPPSQPSMKLYQPKEPTSLFVQYELMLEEPRRTRAKTPVHRIGQLEKKSCKLQQDIDASIALAQQYQAVLPSRESTPCPQSTEPAIRRNGLRRVKCQDSLRALVKTPPITTDSVSFVSSDTRANDYPNGTSPETSSTSRHLTMESCSDSPRPLAGRFPRESFDSHFSTNSSDSETLLGSDSEKSPSSPISHDFPHDFSYSDLVAHKPIQGSNIHDDILDLTMPESDIGMQLTMDLLTNDLATVLHREHPLELGNRASGLQILLMIEAYESLQQKLRQEPAHVTGQEEEHVSDVMDHWLHALRSVYQKSISGAGRDQQEAVAF
ncbi:hypothetical protein D0Z07_8627 [Hyphodiscus hymeniophilus]|uniref:Uncharacterized protein n=1 Tax=Hyphodiscus hymeniophilus TaxID=353542 RepID=A0A9P6SPJ8_9HELO|nr:hypothetical protein D0Z07_8627 [Hyphodiscus hymeniophilus]